MKGSWWSVVTCQAGGLEMLNCPAVRSTWLALEYMSVSFCRTASQTYTTSHRQTGIRQKYPG